MAVAEEEGMMILLAFEGMEQLWRTEVSAGLLRLLIWLVSIMRGPYIKDVRKFFGFFDPLPPLSEFWLEL